MPSSEAPPIIPKERLTAFERWEMGSLGAHARPAAAPQNPQRQDAAQPAQAAVKLPTADDIERIHNEAHKAGYNAGYEEGTARARMEALRLHTMVENMDKSLEELDRQVAQELLTLALELARQIVRQALAVKPELVLETVREALAQLPHQHAAIYLHPEDASLVRAYQGDQLGHAGHRIFEEPQLTRGGCRVEAAGSQVDFSMETRWRRLLESLGRSETWFEEAGK